MKSLWRKTRKWWESHIEEYKFAFKDIIQDIYIHEYNSKIFNYLCESIRLGEKFFINIIGNKDPPESIRPLRGEQNETLEIFLNQKKMFDTSNGAYLVTKFSNEYFDYIMLNIQRKLTRIEFSDYIRHKVTLKEVDLTPKKLINTFQWCKNIMSGIRLDLTNPDLEEEDLINLAGVINKAKKWKNFLITPKIDNIKEKAYESFANFIKNIHRKVSIKNEKKIPWNDFLFFIHYWSLENLEINFERRNHLYYGNKNLKLFHKYNADYYVTEVKHIKFFFESSREDDFHDGSIREGQAIDYETEIKGLEIVEIKETKKVDLKLLTKEVVDWLKTLKPKQIICFKRRWFL